MSSPETIGGYKVVAELGRGAMGIVYRAFDPSIGRPVAIKTIYIAPEATAEESAELRQRLIREASAAGKLSHPSIVTVYQLGEHGSDIFIAMEFVNGKSLFEAMQAGPIPRERALEILTQLADGLDFAHRSGVVHRDVKPANLLIREDGAVKIADFGIAKVMAATTQRMTQAGFSMGSPQYMSPEQVKAEQLDGRSDQFSLAIVAYELLTGRRPFNADSLPALMMQIVAVDPLATAEGKAAVPPTMIPALAKALSKRPEDRFPTCTAFVQALRGDLAVPPLPPVVRTAAAPKSYRLAVLAVLLLALLGAGGYFWWSHRKPASGSVAATESVVDAPLVKAIAEGRLDDAKNLIAQGADVNAATKDGLTPLMQAAEGSAYLPNNTVAVAMLLEQQVDVDAADKRGRTALDHAVSEGKIESVRLLLDHKANPNAKASDGSTPLLTAVTYGKVDILKLLLEHGANIEAADAQGNTALLIAAEGTAYLPNNAPLVELLLAKGAAIEAQDSRGRTPLYRAATEAKNDAVTLLLDKKAAIDHRANDGSTALLETVQFGKLSTLQLLIAHGADVNVADSASNTPLMLAAEGSAYMPNNVPAVTALLAAGAKVDPADSRGRTPFYRAAAEGKVEAMQLLLDKKADLNARATDGSTPLFVAVQSAKLDAVRWLADKGANVNQADANGTTPLMLAAETSPYIKNPLDYLTPLLAHGAKIDSTDTRGRTALDRATESKNTAAIEALRKK
jgi:ankyrin repeat protein/predicted Ser/Thr protein kinase